MKAVAFADDFFATGRRHQQVGQKFRFRLLQLLNSCNSFPFPLPPWPRVLSCWNDD
jgi:hypothetical protein